MASVRVPPNIFPAFTSHLRKAFFTYLGYFGQRFRLCHFAISKCCTLAVAHFLFFACDCQSVTRMLFIVFFFPLLVCLYIYQLTSGLVFTNTGVIMSSTVLQSTRRRVMLASTFGQDELEKHATLLGTDFIFARLGIFLLTRVIEIGAWSANGNVVFAREVSSH